MRIKSITVAAVYRAATKALPAGRPVQPEFNIELSGIDTRC
jgi:hypothetical protein